jgi:putative lipoic acid-binding regulatory protein
MEAGADSAAPAFHGEGRMGIEDRTGSPFGNEELKFPLECHVKIIADADAGAIRAALERALEGMELLTSLSAGNRSESGKFVTYNVAVRMHSKASMDALDAAFRAVPGVRFVL